MSESTLIDSLTSILPRIKPTRQIEPYHPDSAWFRVINTSYVDLSDNDLRLLTAAIRVDPVFAKCINSIATRPDGGRSVSAEHIAHRLLADARQMRPEEAVSRLKEFITLNEVDAILVCALWGLNPANPVEITNEISLVSLEAVPQSQAQDVLLGKPVFKGEGQHRPFTISARPLAALISRVRHRPVFRNDGANTGVSVETGFKSLETIASILPVVLRVPVVPIARWSQIDLGAPFVSGVSGWSEPELRNRYEEKVTQERYDASRLQTLLQAYVRLDDQMKNRLAIPLERFNNALIERDQARGAIELGIALESLLVSGNNNDTSIAYKLRIRGALLLGGDLLTRQRNYGILQAAYDLRSKIVHGKSAPDTVTIRTGNQTTEQKQIDAFLDDAKCVCAKLIEAIIVGGCFPDWDRLQLCCES